MSFHSGEVFCSLRQNELTLHQHRVRISSMAVLPIMGRNDILVFLLNNYLERVLSVYNSFFATLEILPPFFAQKWASLYPALVTSPVSVSPGQWQV